ncbi:hypothetical protein [Streptomyces sp. NPDC001635]
MASGVFSASFWSPRRVDAALVIAATTLGVGNSWIKPSNGLLLTGAPLPLTATVSGAVGLLLWWRRRHPFAVGCLVVLCHLLCFTPAALAIALYTVGTAYRRQARVLAFFVIGSRRRSGRRRCARRAGQRVRADPQGRGRRSADRRQVTGWPDRWRPSGAQALHLPSRPSTE